MPVTVEVFEHHRPLLFGLAYRMLGSASDAEDIVQDAYLRACGAADDEIRTPRAFLATIVTRLCLDQLKAARSVREQYIGPWLPEPVLQQASDSGPAALAEHAETISMAMMVLLERLSPLERGVFVLREAFDFPYEEIGPMLGRSTAACRQAYHRAREHVAAQRPRFQPRAEQQQQLVREFLLATRDGDLATLTRLLAADATYVADSGGTRPAALNPIHGARSVSMLMAGFGRMMAQPNAPTFTATPATINGELGMLIWADGELDGAFIFTFNDTQIHHIHAIRNLDKLAYVRRQLDASA